MTNPEQKPKIALPWNFTDKNSRKKTRSISWKTEATQRKKIWEATVFEVPYEPPKKSVKIKLIKKGPLLPAMVPPDIDETPLSLPKSAPPSLTYKTKNIMKEIQKEIDDFKFDRPVYEVKEFVVEKAFRTKTEQVGNEALADLIKWIDKTKLLKMATKN